MPLLSPDATSADGRVRGGLEGSERPITIMFIDMRDSTTLAEAKMPYDLIFILNQFFDEMTQALATTNGHCAQFTGDGLYALYGLNETNPRNGAADALRGAREMLMRLEQLNRRLENELPRPLRIGIGIHFSEAIVGSMGPPRGKILSAIGDPVNTCARLESLSKDYARPLIVSRPAAEMAGMDVRGLELHETQVKGRVGAVQFYALDSVPQLQA
jgi:adenylate cyclase